jgi:hypothetical protein
MNAATRTLTALSQRGVTRDEKSRAMRCLAVRLGFDRPKGDSYGRWRDV